MQVSEGVLLIKAGFEIAFECKAPTPMLLQVHVRPEREADLVTPDTLRTNPKIPYSLYTDQFGNRCTRILLPSGVTHLLNDFTIRDSGIQDTMPWGAKQSLVN